jgi:hypothetical protein
MNPGLASLSGVGIIAPIRRAASGLGWTGP